MKLSIVATLYKSAPYIHEFYSRVTTTSKDLVADDYEFILVNDGSPDNSLELAIRLTEIDPHVVVVDLSRNFGHHKAMMTGLMHSKGELIFLIDSDLEEEPEWLLPFAKQMDIQKCDVVFGVQKRRKGSHLERWSGLLFYRIFNLLSGIELPDNLVTARLMTRRYVNALMLHQEREVSIAGLWTITGFNQCSYTITKHGTSQTTYTFQKKVSHLVDAVTSFSHAPLVGILYVGLSISAIALAYILFLCFNWIFLANPFSGWIYIMASIWLLGGMIISFLGIIGIYIAKILTETKRRPYTIVRDIYGQ